MNLITSEKLHSDWRAIKARILKGEDFEILHYGDPTGIVLTRVEKDSPSDALRPRLARDHKSGDPNG